MTAALGLVAMVGLALASPNVAAVAPRSSNASSSATDRDAVLAAAIERGEARERDRLLELAKQGLTPAEAKKRLLREQTMRMDNTGEKFLRMATARKSPYEIAAAIPDLVYAGEFPSSSAQLRSPDNVYFPRGQLFYDSGANAWRASQFWDHNTDLASGTDGVGINMTKSIVNLGGHARYCDEYYDPNRCVNNGATWEDPHGAVRRFNSESGDYGTMYLDFRRQRSGCHQMFGHYGHSWPGSSQLTGVNISATGIGFTWADSDGGHWKKQIAGEYFGCG